jgi:hypothetical protein
MMKRALVALLACFGLVAGPAMSGTFTVSSPNPLDSFSIILDIFNNDGFDLLKVTFDTSGTTAIGGGGGPLVFGGFVGTPTDPAGGTSAGFGVLGGTSFGFDFTGFNTGEAFSFGWDPDTASDSGYGAVIAELAGTLVTLDTSGGTVLGVLGIVGQELIVVIASPAPEPGSLALVALGILALAALRRRASS